MKVLIYGASDDLVEVEADEFEEEYSLGSGDTTLLHVADEYGGSLTVLVSFGAGVGKLDWSIAVAAVDAYPEWTVRFHERPGYPGDPAVTIDSFGHELTVTEIRDGD